MIKFIRVTVQDSDEPKEEKTVILQEKEINYVIGNEISIGEYRKEFTLKNPEEVEKALFIGNDCINKKEAYEIFKDIISDTVFCDEKLAIAKEKLGI